MKTKVVESELSSSIMTPEQPHSAALTQSICTFAYTETKLMSPMRGKSRKMKENPALKWRMQFGSEQLISEAYRGSGLVT